MTVMRADLADPASWVGLVIIAAVILGAAWATWANFR